MTAPHGLTLLATHNGTDLDGYASLVALRLLYPGAKLVLNDVLQEIVREVVGRRPPPLPYLAPHEVEPAKIARLVIADTPDTGRIGAWAEELPAGAALVVFDHHPPAESLRARPNTEIVWGEVGSTCTLVTEELLKRNITPEAEDATLLLAGLFEDTGQLAFRSTVPRDFAAAHQLSLWGADPAAAGDILQRLWDVRQNEAYAQVEQSCQTVPWGNLTAAVARIDLPFFVPDAGALASRLHPPGVDAVFLLAGLPQKVFVIARALRAGVDVTEVIAPLGGGGHPEAASAVLREKSLVEAEEELRRAFAATPAATGTARTLMNSPILGIDEQTTLAQAHQLLTRHRIGSLVVYEARRAARVLDFDTAASAIAHGLGEEAALPYARTNIEFVPPDASLQTLRVRLLTSGERIFIVGTPEEATGVVTRRDILRALYEQSLPPQPKAEERPSRGMAKEIKTQLGETAERDLRRIGSLAVESGISLYLVGGTVRDLMLRRRPTDWDLVAVGEFASLLDRLRSEGATIKTHGRYQTAKVRLPDGGQFDIATARRETYLRPGALPDVVPATLEHDLIRRDFTINAMAIDLAPRHFGRLVDRFRGLDDLKRKRIRILHSLSFVDDPSRAFRAVRLAIRFGFQVSDDTLRLMDRAVALRLFSESEGTRLRRELLLALKENEPLAVLRSFEERGLLRACLEDYQLGPHEPYILSALEWTGWYRLQMGHAVDHEDTLLLGSLALGTTATRAQKILAAFKIPPVEAESWAGYRAAAVALEGEANRKRGPVRPSEWVKLLEPASELEILLWGIMHPGRREAVTRFLTQWRHVKPAITGQDLLAMGIPKGPEMGALLARARQAVLDETCPPERQAQLELVRSVSLVRKREDG